MAGEEFIYPGEDGVYDTTQDAKNGSCNSSNSSQPSLPGRFVFSTKYGNVAFSLDDLRNHAPVVGGFINSIDPSGEVRNAFLNVLQPTLHLEKPDGSLGSFPFSSVSKNPAPQLLNSLPVKVCLGAGAAALVGYGIFRLLESDNKAK